jgi:hypothetical protein
VIAFRPHRLAALLLLASLASSVHADENRAPVSPDRDGLAGAKEDYQAIKAAGRPSVQQSLDLPAIPTPVLPSAAEVSPPAVPPRAQPGRDGHRGQADELKDAERKKNWLVDALVAPDEREGGEDAGRRAQFAERDDASSLHDRADEREERVRLSDGTKARPTSKGARSDLDRTDAKQPAFTGINPLDRYMAAWMTPADRTLLLDRPAAASRDDGAPGGSTAPAGGLPDTIPGTFSNAFGPAAASAADTLALRRAAENPFLPPLEPAPPSVSDDLSVAVTAPVSSAGPDLTSPAAPVSDPAPVARPAESLADQLKARDEADRAFRQLKRF